MKTINFDWEKLNIERRASEHKEVTFADVNFDEIKQKSSEATEAPAGSTKRRAIIKPLGRGTLAALRILEFLLVSALALLIVVYLILSSVPKIQSSSIRSEILEAAGSFKLSSKMLDMLSIDRESYPSDSTETDDVKSSSELLSSYISVNMQEEETKNEEDNYPVLTEINYGTVHGALLAVKAPKTVALSVADESNAGKTADLARHVALCDGIAGINAGTMPVGLLIQNNEIKIGNPSARYGIVGFTENGELFADYVTAAEAIDAGVSFAISCRLPESNNPLIISDNVVTLVNTQNLISPRTAIGQTEDGTVLMLVLEGNCVRSAGATIKDVCNIMLAYGAKSAALLDCSTSSELIYDGEIVAGAGSTSGAGQLPNAFVVLRGGEGDD